MELASYIDHTMLRADAKESTILRYCQEAKDYHFASVCVNSRWIKTVARELQGTGVKPCSVIGFPLGAMSTAAKAFEAQQAVLDGAQELDMVISVGEAKAGQWQRVKADIEAVANASGEALLKVIIETCLLSRVEIIKACEIAVEAGADFVKTSTGFSTGGATIEDVRLMRETVGEACGVKASGGIHDPVFAMDLIEAGASRLGASNGLKVIGVKG